MPLRSEGEAFLLAVRVQPRASREGITGRHGAGVKVALNAPPVEGAANEALCALVAKLLGTAKSRVTIQHGATGRDKLLRITGADAGAVAAFLARWGDGGSMDEA